MCLKFNTNYKCKMTRTVAAEYGLGISMSSGPSYSFRFLSFFLSFCISLILPRLVTTQAKVRIERV